MPNVGGKKFPYTPAGMAAAAQARKKMPKKKKKKINAGATYE
tara:strand:+ start:739 stop:864 length:126 start_codon:yes stop_codon:yes gene_type:complete